VRRLLIRSSAFVRAAKRVVKRSPNAAEGLKAALEQLAEDAFHPSLRSHKLKGNGDAQSPPQAGGIEAVRRAMKRYAIVIEKAESNFAAYVPDLPGCVATGSRVE